MNTKAVKVEVAATLSIIVALMTGLLIGLLSNWFLPIRQISCKPTSPLGVVARLVP